MHAAIVSALLTVAAAQQWGGGNWGGPGGPGGPGAAFGGIPSCVGSCLFTSSCSQGDFSCYCSSTSIDAFNTCIKGGSCSDADKSAAYQAIDQFCANSGATVTASQEATYSATSGECIVRLQSLANSIGGSAWPTQWTSNSAWTAALSSWKTQTTGAPGPFGAGWANGWSAGDGYGPFGRGGPGNGWGPYASESTGAWTSGPWTKWWGTNACPPSTWSGKSIRMVVDLADRCRLDIWNLVCCSILDQLVRMYSNHYGHLCYHDNCFKR